MLLNNLSGSIKTDKKGITDPTEDNSANPLIIMLMNKIINCRFLFFVRWDHKIINALIVSSEDLYINIYKTFSWLVTIVILFKKLLNILQLRISLIKQKASAALKPA